MSELKKLVEAGVHFGHKTSRWHPKMNAYIWGTRNHTHLIDIAKTSFLLKRAKAFLKDVATTDKPILLVGTKKAAQSIIKKMSAELNLPYVSHRWIGGTLSNFEQVRKAVTRLLHLRDVVEKSITKYSKKEQSMITKELERLEKNCGGIIDMKSLPSALVIVDARKERSAIKEAIGMNIPVISMVDTNTDPTGISYIIPSNDDSPKSIECILSSLAESIKEGALIAAKEKEEKAALAAKAAEEKRAAKAAAKAKKEAAEKKDTVAAAPKKVEKDADKVATAKAAPKKAPATKKAAAPKKATSTATAAKKTPAKTTAKKPEAKAAAPAKKAPKAAAEKAPAKKKATPKKKEEAK